MDNIEVTHIYLTVSEFFVQWADFQRIKPCIIEQWPVVDSGAKNWVWMSIDEESLPESYNFEIEKKVAKSLAAVGTGGMDWTLENSQT